MTLAEELSAALDELRRDSLERSLRLIESAQEAEVRYGGRDFVMLSSNNYLGLAAHPGLKRAAAEALARWGVGAGASRLIAGSLGPLHELEAALARFKGTEAALVFGSGFLANVGTISALCSPRDVVLSDELNHASIIDGCRLSRATVRVYRHRDPTHLKVLLEESAGARRRLVVTDAVFSMDGDLAPLETIVALACEYRASVMVDEAHAVGVFGPRGEGLGAELGVDKEIDVQMGTLSKALGAYGGYVAGSRALIDFLINRARSFIYTTGLAPALAAAAGAALKIVESEPERSRRLWENAAYLKEGLVALGFRIGPTASPIIPVMVGASETALSLSERLLARGIYVTAIRPPTVPPGTARLRVTPTAAHTREHLARALAAFAEAGRELGLVGGGSAGGTPAGGRGSAFPLR